MLEIAFKIPPSNEIHTVIHEGAVTLPPGAIVLRAEKVEDASFSVLHWDWRDVTEEPVELSALLPTLSFRPLRFTRGALLTATTGGPDGLRNILVRIYEVPEVGRVLIREQDTSEASVQRHYSDNIVMNGLGAFMTPVRRTEVECSAAIAWHVASIDYMVHLFCKPASDDAVLRQLQLICQGIVAD